MGKFNSATFSQTFDAYGFDHDWLSTDEAILVVQAIESVFATIGTCISGNNGTYEGTMRKAYLVGDRVYKLPRYKSQWGKLADMCTVNVLEYAKYIQNAGTTRGAYMLPCVLENIQGIPVVSMPKVLPIEEYEARELIGYDAMRDLREVSEDHCQIGLTEDCRVQWYDYSPWTSLDLYRDDDKDRDTWCEQCQQHHDDE